MYRLVNDEYLEQISDLLVEQVALNEAIQAAPDPEERFAALQDLAATFSEVIASRPPLEVNMQLHLVGLRVYVEDGHILSIVLT